MFLTGDPERDFDLYEAEQEKTLNKFPKCHVCDEHIQQEDAVCIDGHYYCDECLNEMRKTIGD